MTPRETARFRKLLESRREELATLSEDAAEKRKPVELDQQSVGRLSRQDALQQQAMAKAQDARRLMEIRKIDAALQRIDGDAFGWCEACGEMIAIRRLEIDPTTLLCVGCASQE